MANEFKVKNGLIVIGDLTTSGTITINGALAATQSWVTSQAYLTSASLSGYATQSYVTSALAALVDAAPAALDTLNELAAALGDDANFSTTITNSIAAKQAQLNGTGLVRMSGTSVSYDNTTYLISNFGNIEGEHGYGYPSSDGWYKIAEIVLTSSCQSFNLWGEYRDTGYFDNSHYRIHITARAECDFPTNNESHAINVNMYGSSTNETYFNNNVRVVLTSSSSNYRKYELQYYRATWDTGSWNLQTLGWTTYTTSQTAGTPTGTPRVYYISKFVADNIYAANKISIGTTYSGFAANIAGTTYVIGASVWVNDGYGISNASSGGTGFFPYSDGTLVFNSVNSEKMRVASSGNVGIGTNSPGYKLEVNGGATGNNIARFTTGGTGGGTRGLTVYSDNSQVKLQVTDNAGSQGTWAFLNLNPDGGNVGVGTTSPDSRFTVKGDNALVDVQSTADGQTIGFLARYLNSATLGGAFRYTTGDAQLYIDNFFQGNNGVYSDINIRNCDTGGNLINRIKIKGSSGNVGIGTSSPGNILTVNGDTRLVTGTTQGLFAYDAPSGGAFIWSLTRYTDTNANDLNVNTRSGFGIRTGVESLTNSGHQFYVTSVGNVGIGTTAPTHLLSLSRTTQAAAYQLNINNVGGISDGNFTGIRFSQDSNAATELGNIKLHYYSTGATDLSLGTRYSPTAVYIQSGGNVGVGTSSPGAKLHVAGNAWINRPSNKVDNASCTELPSRVEFNNAFAAGASGYTVFTYPTPSVFRIYGDYDGHIGGLQPDLQLGLGYLTVKNSGGTIGNIGIGTTAPTHRLTVAGGNVLMFPSDNTRQLSFFNDSYGITASSGLELITGDYIRFRQGSTELARLTTTGLGVGTSTPSEKFHVSGAAIFDGGSGNSSTDAVVYITKSNNNDWGLYVNASGLDYGMYTRVSPSAGYAIGVNNGTNWTTRITGDGRIYLNEKDTIASYDTWLRLNESGHYGSGVYTPGVMRADGGFNVSGSQVWHAGNDGSGSGLDADLLDGQNSTEFLRLLSGGAEASLDSYTDNGFRSVSFAGHSQHLLSWNAGGSTGTVQQLFHYGTPNNGWRIRNKTDNTSWSDWGYVVMASSNQGLISGTIATQSWVGSQSYATTSYVTTQINNLINGAPGVLDTLDELAAALGDDANFATTVTNSIAGKVSKTGDTMTGALTIQNGVSATWDYMTLEHPGPHARINLGNAENGFLIAHEGTTTATFATNGNLTITGALIETSSIKVKENVKTSEGNLEKVVNLRPVTYNKIGSQTTELGLIAEEVAEVYPEFVQYDENGEPIGVHYSRLTAALIGAVKELNEQLQELKRNK